MMGLSIKNEEVEARIRRLTELTGEGVTEAIDRAVRERLEREEAARAQIARMRIASWRAFQSSHGPVATLDQQAIDCEMYDEFGLPR